ncbi:hypothetical protein CTAYLR_004829 [Chrysophaeum taylorii]|uniref:Uncharacterized protein n=1 Tax=Chrysophaeum taylorii TaxID=2483200 RepID=A0AAD7UE49_9STRA|nr:hypothetical protein CTAYLR_004829 [Chrysophaeum taylorii]
MFFFVVVFAGIAEGVTTNYVSGACAEDAVGDLFPEKWESRPEFSLLWNVSYHESYKILTNRVTETKFVLYQCGTTAPEIPNATLVQVPVTRAATTSTTYLPFFEMIGERSSLKAYTSSFDYVSSPCLRRMYVEGEIEEAYDASTWSINQSKLEGIELTIADAWTASSVPNGYVMTDTSEDSVLETVEYVHVVGLFFNREREATEAAQHIYDSYRCVSEEVSAVTADLPNRKVVWASYWDAADGWSIAACPNWYCEIVESAGGEIIVPEVEPEVDYFGYPYLSTDQIRDLLVDADLLVSPGPFPDDMTLNITVFDNQGPLGANDWFERRHVEPDVLLQDLATVFWPDVFDYSRKFLRNVETEAPGQRPSDDELVDLCPDVEAPYDFESAECPSLDDAASGAGTSSSSSSKKKKKGKSAVVWVAAVVLVLFIFALIYCILACAKRATFAKKAAAGAPDEMKKLPQDDDDDDHHHHHEEYDKK